MSAPLANQIDDLFNNFERKIADVNGQKIAYRIGGSGQPVLLLHGFPQNHAMWHHIANDLAKTRQVICADLRGYGDSSKPKGDPNHHTYSKREMAKDMVALMDSLGHSAFQLVGHDRGGRVAHRLTLDHPEKVQKLCVLDIIPTLTFFDSLCQKSAEAYYHWFFLSQAAPFPEEMIAANPSVFLNKTFSGLGTNADKFDAACMADYQRCFDTDTIHAICEDYRAAASIDLEHDREDKKQGNLIKCPTLVLWGCKGLMHKRFDFIQAWREKAEIVTGQSINAGHFLCEENPQPTSEAIQNFLNCNC
ncbi:MAG: alpha/beta hydrolase [Alphaproteobacteria bacterium]|nr:alpha/beta hydrolase [Alphaproteobacteria bacterium]